MNHFNTIPSKEHDKTHNRLPEKDWYEPNNEGIQVLYRGVDITNKIALCHCLNCTRSIREEINKKLKVPMLTVENWMKKNQADNNQSIIGYAQSISTLKERKV